MTNYDRWKLATPPYLEDTDGEDDALHGDGTSGKDGEEPSSSDEPDTENDQG
jgi:hypothetical protein